MAVDKVFEPPIQVATAAEMHQLAGQLAQTIPAPSLWLLSGPVGAGKTTFVQGFVAGLDRSIRVQSPTYALARTYRTQPPVVHIDLYRYVDAGATVLSLGIDELCDRDDAHVLLEWPTADGHRWAAPTAVVFHVDIVVGDHDHRTLSVRRQ